MWWPDYTVDHVSGGSKHMEMIMHAWGVDGFDQEGFFNAVKDVEWRMKEQVQIFVKGQDDKRFVVYILLDVNTWTQYNEVELE